jgi:hypothetical protein
LAALPLVGMPSFVKRGIEAWHGSPHKFDSFSLKKIGTGEGAQVRGHGLYFAENPEVAKYYRKMLTNGKDWDIEGVNGTSVKVPDWVAQRIEGGHMTLDDAIAEWTKRVNDMADALATSSQPWLIESNLGHLTKTLEGMERMKAGGGVKIRRPGALYRVGLEVDPDDLLDLDAPMHQQSKKVQSVLEDMGVFDFETIRPDQFPVEGVTLYNGGRIDEVGNGRYVYRSPNGNEFPIHWEDVERLYGNPMLSGDGAQMALSRRHGAEGVSALLASKGIPGSKYFDQGSRSASEGTRNYVMFDDKRINILERLAALGLLAGGSGAIASKTQKDQKDSQ